MSTLFVVSTPIGNLEDITLRAIRILKEADIIAAEDTRHTRKLLTHYDIHGSLLSFHNYNERQVSEKFVRLLLEGKKIALVSDAGTPGISDPGFRLVKASIDAEIKVEIIPGPSAVISALAVSGLPTDQFTFVGFLPDKDGKRKNRLLELKDLTHTLVFYVSKWKAEKAIEAMIEVFGEREAVLCRELTKAFEEVKRSTLSGLLEHVKGREIKGELTLVVAGLS